MRRIAILGAGPIGLEAAVAARQAGHDVTVHEASTTGVGGHVRGWAHVRTFTPWSLTVSPRVQALLGDAVPAGDGVPTGGEIVAQLLEPLAAHPLLAGRVRLGSRVVAVARSGLLKHEEIASATRAARPFRLLLRDATTGHERVEEADVVIDATGLAVANRLGDGGIDAVGESRFEDRIGRGLAALAAGGHDRYAGRRVLLTGAGHSAQTAARDLAARGIEVVWAIRATAPTFGAVPGDRLPERAALNARATELAAGAAPHVAVLRGVVTEALEADGDRIAVTLRNGGTTRVVVDDVLALNGSVGDASLYRQLQVHECYASLGPMKLAATLGEPGGDCLAVDAGAGGPELLTNPEPGFFILGAKSYGRNPSFLLRTGWQQVDDVVGSLL